MNDLQKQRRQKRPAPSFFARVVQALAQRPALKPGPPLFATMADGTPDPMVGARVIEVRSLTPAELAVEGWSVDAHVPALVLDGSGETTLLYATDAGGHRPARLRVFVGSVVGVPLHVAQDKLIGQTVTGYRLLTPDETAFMPLPDRAEVVGVFFDGGDTVVAVENANRRTGRAGVLTIVGANGVHDALHVLDRDPTPV